VAVAVDHANIQLIRVHAKGELPSRPGEAVGRFLTVQNPDSLEVADCELNHTAGIYVLGFGKALPDAPSIWIHDNRVRDIDGRVAGAEVKKRAAIVQFVQLDKVRHVAGIDISWNQVINTPGNSAVEDVISIYKSSGVPYSAIRIHDNGIRGAYPVDPQAAGYSGGGIMLGDGAETDPANGPAYVEAYGNTVLDTTNYGIAISGGHHCVLHDNRIVSSGVLRNGLAPASQNVGVYIWDANKKEFPHANFHDNGGRGNVIGWIHDEGRNDWWTPDAAFWERNERLSGPITHITVDQEWKLWFEKLKAHRASTRP
jgi:hypothetical protein